jgi:hypothetical protein
MAIRTAEELLRLGSRAVNMAAEVVRTMGSDVFVCAATNPDSERPQFAWRAQVDIQGTYPDVSRVEEALGVKLSLYRGNVERAGWYEYRGEVDGVLVEVYGITKIPGHRIVSSMQPGQAERTYGEVDADLEDVHPMP